MPDLVRFTVSLPARLSAAFDQYLSRRDYPSRSEAVRDLIRDALIEEQWASSVAEVAGTVTIVYDHHRRELTDRLTRLQHDYHDVVLSTTHVHLDHDNCLEVIILRGPVERVRAIGNRLMSIRGVKHGKMTCTSSGAGLE
ncbi:MAG: nickel-responsive transcriptional regulator NikR [Chthonomonadales bacterium]|nr:nickel-responsive transcriptional regulator NikR [Chthonomonadales bacterium]